MNSPIAIFWFRRDLRWEDNPGLYHAFIHHEKVLPLFIFDTDILDRLEDKKDRRVDFIHRTIISMQQDCIAMGKSMWVEFGNPVDVFNQLLKTYEIAAVYTNHDYALEAIERDSKIERLLESKQIPLLTFKDHVIFEKSEIIKEDGKPYTVFTPYAKKWKQNWQINPPVLFPSEKHLAKLVSMSPRQIPSLNQIGFQSTDLQIPSKVWESNTIENYTKHRDFPSLENGTSHLSVHLRFGTISIRQLALGTSKLNDTFLNELIWRDFYQMILWHFPHVGKGKSFKAQYDFIQWRNNEKEFEAWCKGMTGYPIVDAGMRELNATGWMHNRVRMIVASFLTKHLLIDWRWGEAYFAQKLIDYDLAANNGGWQWASGSGCDAAPYFRVFNPSLQTEKFDKDLRYIKKWVPELDNLDYPIPMVEHKFARERVLKAYAKALKES